MGSDTTMTTSNSFPKDFENYLKQPPIYWLSATADLISNNDEHLNFAWRGMVQKNDPAEICSQMVLKYFGDNTIKMSIELACGLAAVALKLPVPLPALVICDRQDLHNLPIIAKGERILVFGSQLIPEDTIYATFRKNDMAAAEYVWEKVCKDQIGKQGAAWDELIANPDRHHLNLIFDIKWWLFDHDKAIPTAKETANLVTASATNPFPSLILKMNQLAEQMLKRYPKDHAIESQIKEFDKQKSRLNALDHCVKGWKSQINDNRIIGIFEDTALIVNMIASRLPALAMHLKNRINEKNNDRGLLWTSPNQN